MSYRYLDHTTDAFIEVTARDLVEAFSVTADAVINLTLNQDKVKEEQEMIFSATGKDIEYLLFSWLEELVFVLITEGFAIRRTELEIVNTESYCITAKAFGEPLDIQRHGFKVEIKAPTFHGMEIRQDDGVFFRFLLDL